MRSEVRRPWRRRAEPIACVVALLAFGCGPSRLTRDEAAALLSKSPALQGVQNIQIVTPRGCFTVEAATPIDRINPRTDTAVFTGHEHDALKQEVDVHLVEFELAEKPLASPTPLDGCESLWLSFRTGANRDLAPFLKVVAWRTFLSDRAVAAGLQVGETILYRRQTLLSIDGLAPRTDGTTVVTYTWRWAPSEDGAHLGIPPGAPSSDVATFVRAGGRWQARAQ